MKIAILNLTSGGISGGYRKYLRNLIPRIARHPKVSALLVGLPRPINLSEWKEAFPFANWQSLKPCKWPVSDLNSDERTKIKEFAPDVVFIPTARFCRIDGVPTVNMIRNMEPFVDIDENPILERILNCMRAKETRNSLLKADRTIAVSGFVRQFITDRWGVNPEKVGLVYHGVENMNGLSLKKPASILQSWKGDFLFTAGSIRPARGLEDAIFAVRQISGKRGKDCKLAVAGSVTWNMRGYYRKLKTAVRCFGLESSILFTGPLSEQEMCWCYQHCKMFLMTSRVEACPNIALEIMANGCIAIVADNPPLPEMLDNTAIFYPPRKQKVLAELIQRVLNMSEEQLNAMRKRCLERAAKFSQDKCARLTVAELIKAAGCTP